MNTKLYVGNLAPTVSEADLLSLFSQAGAVTEVAIALDSATQRSRGFGFVTMATPELAAAALRDFHGYEVGGRHITVTEARPPQTPTGLMSEGFNYNSSGSFRPVGHDQKRRPPGRGARQRRRGR